MGTALDSLTSEQAAAVESDRPVITLLAGAGAGKTRVLTTRIVRLVESGIEPEAIMCLTFSRRAAGEMRARLAGMIGESSERVTLGTFHAVALGILQQFGHLAGFREGEPISVYDEDVSNVMLERVCSELGHIRKGKWSTKGLSSELVRGYRESMAVTGSPPAGLGPDLSKTLLTIWGEYRSRLRRNNAVDYGLCLLEATALLDHAEVAGWRSRFRHVLVDESQDTDAVQHDFVGRLCPPAHVLFVGDPRQAIYGWRGGRPDLAIRPESQVLHLSRNHRSAQAIVHAANRLIAHNQDPDTKPMEAVRPERGRAEYTVASIADSAWLVHQAIEEQLYAPEEIAVLARTHDWLDAITGPLQAIDIQVNRVGRTASLDESADFRIVHAAMSWLVNPEDSVAFALLEPYLGIETHGHASVIRLLAHRQRSTLWDAYWSHRSGELPTALGTVLSELHDVPQAASVAAGRICEAIAQQFGSGRYDEIVRYWSRMESATIAEALRWHALRDREGERENRPGVTLSTIHAAKGLEWPCVFILGACEEVFPNLRDGPDAIMEERRLAYVAFTRACDRLCVVVPTVRVGNWWGSAGPPAAQASRFVSEAGLDQMEVS